MGACACSKKLFMGLRESVQDERPKDSDDPKPLFCWVRRNKAKKNSIMTTIKGCICTIWWAITKRQTTWINGQQWMELRLFIRAHFSVYNTREWPGSLKRVCQPVHFICMMLYRSPIHCLEALEISFHSRCSFVCLDRIQAFESVSTEKSRVDTPKCGLQFHQWRIPQQQSERQSKLLFGTRWKSN